MQIFEVSEFQDFKIPNLQNVKVAQIPMFYLKTGLKKNEFRKFEMMGAQVFQNVQDVSSFSQNYFWEMSWYFLVSFQVSLHKIREPKSNKMSESENVKQNLTWLRIILITVF